MPGFWKRPVNRTYSYNLSLGEHYYSPMTSYLESERGSRGDGPGALTYSERLARKWLHGRKYDSTEIRDRYERARSVAATDLASANFASSAAAAEEESNVGYLNSEMARRSARAMSEMRTSSSTSIMSRRQMQQQIQQQQESKLEMQMSARQEIAARQEASRKEFVRQEKRMAESSSLTQSSAASKKSVIQDDICKKVADVRMMPWEAGKELSEAQSASARAKARILELEKELELITQKAMMSTSRAVKTASQMAAQASMEDEAAVAASTKKSRKVIMESSSKIVN